MWLWSFWNPSNLEVETCLEGGRWGKEKGIQMFCSLWPSWLCEPLRPFHLLGTFYICKMKTKCLLLLGLNKDKVGSVCGSVERVC